MKIYLKVFLPLLILLPGITNIYAQDGAKIEAKIKKAYEVLSSGDLANLGDYIVDNFNDHSPFPDQKPGLEGVKEVLQGMRKSYPDLKFTINDIIVNSANDKAAVLYTLTGTNTGEQTGMKPTNKSFNIQGIDILYINKDGKATDRWGFMDTQKMMKQLGMMPEGEK